MELPGQVPGTSIFFQLQLKEVCKIRAKVVKRFVAPSVHPKPTVWLAWGFRDWQNAYAKCEGGWFMAVKRRKARAGRAAKPVKRRKGSLTALGKRFRTMKAKMKFLRSLRRK